MKSFLDEDFLLQSEAAKKLYHNYASSQPIFDFHNHLSAQEIFENKSLGNLANAWLDHDHYKWRAMRAAGVSELLITGHIRPDGTVKSEEELKPVLKMLEMTSVEQFDYARYLAFVETLQGCVGNPLYHWSHLELQRYFEFSEAVTQENAKEVWNKCNDILAKKDFGPRGLLSMQKVKALCTTDDPCDNLEWHKKLAQDWSDCKVLPSFRPDFILNCENSGFSDYLDKLQKVSGIRIKSLDDMLSAVSTRMDYFKSCGSVVSDHSLENDFFLPAVKKDVEYIFNKAWMGKKLNHDEIAQYKGFMLVELGKLYAKKGFVMQLHIGALRDQNTGMFNVAGKNVGEDSLNDFNYVSQLGAVLNGIYSSCDNQSNSPKVILYNLNPKDNDAIATMAANFRNCVFGPAWWFCDHKDGIEQQIKVFARTSVLGKYVGMLTDSRSFLSYPRHEYFRRILCNYVGNLVENGEFPANEKLLGKMICDISYQNSIDFFNLNQVNRG